MPSEDIFIVHPSTAEQANALKAFIKALKIKFELAKEKPYNLDYVTKIKRSDEDFKNGRLTTVEINDLNKYIENL